MPIVIFTGNVTASAIGKKSPGFALGTDTFIAAGTAIYEALAAKIANINLLLISFVINWLRKAMTQPLIKGITMAKTTGNHPKAKNDFSFFSACYPHV